MSFSDSPAMPRQDGRVAIVTGGGRGIGYEVVRHLARLGAHVIIGIVWITSPLNITMQLLKLSFHKNINCFPMFLFTPPLHINGFVNLLFCTFYFLIYKTIIWQQPKIFLTLRQNKAALQSFSSLVSLWFICDSGCITINEQLAVNHRVPDEFNHQFYVYYHYHSNTVVVFSYTLQSSHFW